MIELRPYQRAAVAAIEADFEAGVGAALLVLATGLGKTVVFSEIARRHVDAGMRVLVLAHRGELLDQARAKLHAAGVDAAIERAGQRAGDAAVVVASVQTLRGRRLEAFAPDVFGLVVVDEAHHAPAAGYRAILDRFAGARVLGVTATPDRLDGQALGGVFESVPYRYEFRAAIADGWLAPLRARRVRLDGLDLAAVHTRAGDLDRGELAAAMAAEETLHGVAVPLLEQAGDRPTIVFGVDVAHARAVAEILCRYRPGVARAVDGDAPAAERGAAIEDLRAGRLQVLVNCALFVEGFDEPSISCVAIARPTKSRALYAQMVGRATRLAPGKADALILDFTGAAGRHRLIGPADVLAGATLADDVRAEAERVLERAGEQGELEAVLAHADAEAARIRHEHAVTAVARYQAEEVDPFVVDLPPAPAARWARELATDAQRRALADAGLKEAPETLTKGEASRWLDAIARRRATGLATLRQARLLRRYGVDARAMSKGDATEQIERIKAGGWKRSAAPPTGTNEGAAA